MHNIMLFIPAYNCENQIPRVISQLSQGSIIDLFEEVIIIDNISPDKTIEAAKTAIKSCNLPTEKFHVFRNQNNYSLGGSHKMAFKYFKSKDFSHFVILHGDDQGSIKDLVPYIVNKEAFNYECFLGARFHKESKLVGYSKFRTIGNILFNILFSMISGKKVLDLGAGLNMYSRSFLQKSDFALFPNNLTFNVYLLLYGIYSKSTLRFFPLSWREDDQVSNAKIFSQAFKTMKILFNSKIDKSLVLEAGDEDIIKRMNFEEIKL